ncbi:hypothetical protein C8J56DRAFT_787767 [Mycena floridula]|nr:hypothetical protein C8J56DRAFT_787767 [Mycena floridula]
MNKQKIAGLALQETRLLEEQIAEIEQSSFSQGLEIYASSGSSSSGGVAMVFNQNLTNVEGIKCYEVVPGKAILLVHPWHGAEVETILVVYALCNKPENGTFWDELLGIWRKYKLPIPTKVLGDTSITLEPLDR